ncbi:hypothetical protein ABIE89_000035 [Bradyrhizobium niftali]|uniref:hypothetical protein n=1 Tax=Bradyrhizobium niftali TaxID=2560055 RepID=UPI00383274CB
MARLPLYPSADQLIVNNYPPLSFFVVGALGRLFRDSLFVGRALSIIGLLTLAVEIALSVRILAGSLLAGVVGGLWFVAIMARTMRRAAWARTIRKLPGKRSRGIRLVPRARAVGALSCVGFVGDGPSRLLEAQHYRVACNRGSVAFAARLARWGKGCAHQCARRGGWPVRLRHDLRDGVLHQSSDEPGLLRGHLVSQIGTLANDKGAGLRSRGLRHRRSSTSTATIISVDDPISRRVPARSVQLPKNVLCFAISAEAY